MIRIEVTRWAIPRLVQPPIHPTVFPAQTEWQRWLLSSRGPAGMFMDCALTLTWTIRRHRRTGNILSRLAIGTGCLNWNASLPDSRNAPTHSRYYRPFLTSCSRCLTSWKRIRQNARLKSLTAWTRCPRYICHEDLYLYSCIIVFNAS